MNGVRLHGIAIERGGRRILDVPDLSIRSDHERSREYLGAR